MNQRADLVIPAENPLEMPSEQISSLKVHLTMLGGEIVDQNAN
ncbi:MAG: hypothetical protein ACR2PL_22910 [Dehalococcoidia bacterium]